MRKKINLEEKEKELLEFWIKEKEGLGLKKYQLSSEIKKTHISLILRKLRKEKKILLKRKRWFLNPDFYKKLKEEIQNGK